MFTPSERESFTTHGLFKRHGFLSNMKLANARALIFEHLERAGIWRDGSWHFEQTAPDYGMALIKPLNHHPAIVELASRSSQEIKAGDVFFGIDVAQY